MICRYCKLDKKNSHFKNLTNLNPCKECQKLLDKEWTPKDLSKEYRFCSKCEEILPKGRFILNYKNKNQIIYSKQCDSCKPRKRCADCNQMVSLSRYNKRGLSETGKQRYDSRCSRCRKKYRKKAPLRKREADGTYLCRVCDKTKPEKDFYDVLKAEKKRTGTCRTCQKKKIHKNNLECIRLLKPWYMRSLLNNRFGKSLVYADNEDGYTNLMEMAKEKIIMERKIKKKVQVIKTEKSI